MKDEGFPIKGGMEQREKSSVEQIGVDLAMKTAIRPAGQQPSTFFPSTRNDEAILGQQEHRRKQLSNGITLEPVIFPATKSILWDRTAQGETEVLHLTAKRNVRLFINEKTLRLAQRHVNRTNSYLECFLVGSISVDAGEDGIDITVDRFDPGREVLVKNGSSKVKRKVPTTVVPGDHIVPITLIQGLSGAEDSTTHTTEEFHKALKVLHGRISGQEPINLSHLISLKACCHTHGGEDELVINVNCGAITMATVIQATPVAAIPIIPTALARNLSGPLRLSEVQGMAKSGYLTMDHTRKLLLLLETDPKALSMPLLGIWVSGVYNIHHPFIWACCLRYLHSTAIQQRVFAPPKSFILLLYTPVKSTPDFWECQRQEAQPDVSMFELYSCYENLHLETPPSSSASEPLCFELFPSPGGMSRSHFQQAAGMWEEEHKQERLGQSESSPHQSQLTTETATSSGEEPSPVPRPSPSPHPQNVQLILPAVEETSLSLSFDDQTSAENLQHGLTNQQVLRPTHSKIKQTKPQMQQRHRKSQEQENERMNNRQRLSSVKETVLQRSPLREPLKQISDPNQTQSPVMNHRLDAVNQNHYHGSVIQKPPNQRGCGCQHNVSPNQGRMRTKGRHLSAVKEANVDHGAEGGSDQQKQDRRAKSMPQDSEVNHTVRVPNFQNQAVVSLKEQGGQNRDKDMDRQQAARTRDKQQFHDSCPPSGNQMKSRQLETVHERQRHKGTDIQNVTATGSELTVEGSTLDRRQTAKAADSPLSADQNQADSSTFSPEEQNEHEYILPNRGSVGSEHGVVNPHNNPKDGDKEKGKDVAGFKSNSKADEQAVFGTRSAGASKDSQQVMDFPAEDQNKSLLSLEASRPDPYELLIRQEVQLRELQEQIKLLLQQQNTPVPTPNTMLTPPRTPKEYHQDNHQSPQHAHVSMVTTCTNTGASLLLVSPVKANGKKSAATSPMKEREMPLKCAKGQGKSQEKSNQSQAHTLTVNSDEFTNQMVGPDDPSRTLASSLNAVDIPSFHGSPSGMTSPSILGQAQRGGMETSFTSPVLGESASVLIEERQKEPETPDDEKAVDEEDSVHKESNHVSLLQRNERQFYDNLLDQVKNLLDQQTKEKDTPAEPSQDSVPEQPATTHEPTREEVVMATMKELEKIKASAFGNGKQNMKSSPKQLTHQRSVPDHPHINCLSLSVDETLDEVFSEADTIALKYLTDNQLQELRQVTVHRKGQGRTRVVTFSALHNTEKSTLLGRMAFEREHLQNSSSLNEVDYTWNNLSMATKEYLGKYCLAPQPNSGSVNNDASMEALPMNVTDTSRSERRVNSSVESRGCKAPPSTPEPTSNDNGLQILDINRLKKLPKLF